jgi:hypothetical protein
MDWSAPYRWTLIDRQGVIPCFVGSDVEYQFTFKDRATAESMVRWAARLQIYYRAVPVPFTGRG